MFALTQHPHSDILRADQAHSRHTDNSSNTQRASATVAAPGRSLLCWARARPAGLRASGLASPPAVGTLLSASLSAVCAPTRTHSVSFSPSRISACKRLHETRQETTPGKGRRRLPQPFVLPLVVSDHVRCANLLFLHPSTGAGHGH
eukprot:1079755-Rhodomonas_salina.1